MPQAASTQDLDLHSKGWHSLPSSFPFLFCNLLPHVYGDSSHSFLSSAVQTLFCLPVLVTFFPSVARVYQYFTIDRKSNSVALESYAMPAYQVRRPTPVKIFPRRVRRQVETEVVVPVEEEEEDSGPESPDSPLSSPDVAGVLSDDEDSDTEDDQEQVQAPSAAPTDTVAAAPSTTIEEGQSTTSTTVLPASSVDDSPATTSADAALPTSDVVLPAPAFSGALTSQNNNAVQPIVTQTDLATAIQPTETTAGIAQPSDSGSSEQDTSIPSQSTFPPTPAESESSSTTSSPQQTTPQPEQPIMTKGAAIAAAVLGVTGTFSPATVASSCRV